jgi:hypothetical protein
MANFQTELTVELREFIAKQHMFFVATAPLKGDGRINLSPKGLSTFRVLSDREVAYLDYTGSGNETAAHVLENRRITIMFCSFEGPPDGKPLILRLYGRGTVVHAPGLQSRGNAIPPLHQSEASLQWNELIERFGDAPLTGVRQIIRVQIESLQTSCGFGVPVYEFKGHRDLMIKWCEKKSDGGLREYRAKKNRVSIDGLPTGLPA